MAASKTTPGERLQNNPFYILDVSYSADRREIVAAADERSFFEDADKCVEAQNALLNPGKRLSAELDWFPDTDEENVGWIKKSLESGGRIPIGEFGAVSQLNAELYNLGFFDMTQPQQLVRFERALCNIDRLYTRLDGKEIAQTLNQHRQAARMAEVSVQEVEQELAQKRYRIRRVLSECLQRMSDADCTEKVLKIAQTYIEDNKGNPGIVLLDFVSQYELRMQPKIDALSEKIDAKINFCKMRTGGVLDGALDELMKEVAAWAALVKPMMICGKANGRSHEGTSAMGNKLRNLALYLHNEKEQTAAAAKLTEAMLGIFTYDRMFHNKLTEEVKTLKKLSSQRQNAESLKEEIDQLLALVNSAEKWANFEISGKMEELALLVMQLDKKLKELAKEDKELHKIREVIAMAARSVSVVLHNKYNMTQMAVDFMEFLMDLFADIPNLRSKLRNDKAELDRQLTLARQLGVSLRRETVPFQSLASQASDVWLLNKGKDYQNKKDYKNAFLYYKRAAEMGNADAQNFVGVFYNDGKGVIKDYKEALVWYHRAVENGCATAASNIASCYEHGHGVPQDEAEGFRWRKKSAEMGYSYAAKYVADCYFDGRKVEKDYVQAAVYYEKAANLGNTICMLKLGDMYERGMGVPTNKGKALYWYVKAADKGDRTACSYAAQMYERGEGTPKDIEKAKEYYLLGSSKGSVFCTVSAALLFVQDTDNASKREAVRLCDMAIQQGTKDSRIYRALGEAYMNGQGTEKNYEKAREMYRQANDTNALIVLEQRIAEERLAEEKRQRKRSGAIMTAIATLVLAVLCWQYNIYQKGIQAYEKGDNETAVAYLGNSFIGRKEYSEALCNIGSELLDNGNFTEAYKYFEKASNPPEDKLRYCHALVLLNGFADNLDDDTLESIQSDLNQSGSIMNSQKYREIIGEISQENFVAAAKLVNKLPENSKDGMQAQVWREILLKYIPTKYGRDVQEALGQLYVKTLAGNRDKDYKSEKFSKVIDLPVIGQQSNSGEIAVASENEVYKQYGSCCDGKILIVKKTHPYGDKIRRTSICICVEAMEYLPYEYIPSSIDEVEYVVVLAYDYEVTGTYTYGTKALQENAVITVYSLKEKDTIYTSDTIEGGNPPRSFQSDHILSYKSGGSPKVSKELGEALDSIIK